MESMLHFPRIKSSRPTLDWVCASCRHQRSRSTQRVFSGLTTTRRPDKPIAGRLSDQIQSNRRRHASNDTARRAGKLPDTPARTRFAPSPTGYMHIGGLRTALFSYLLAKRTQGQFLLRIEDTDQKRLVPDAEDRLCQDLQWAGLQWDEGPQVGGPYGPYKQSERNEIYQRHATDLLNSGSAYRCFCTTQTTNAQGGKAAYVTSGCYQDCSSRSSEAAQDRAESKNEIFTVRLKQPADAHKRVYSDLIYGKIQRLKRSPSASQNAEDDSGIDAADTVLMKSDGTPTYHFANVVDDHLMKITHVIRGSEWMASTPLHYDLYTAFGWTPPAFAHVGLLVDENKAKLSKRSDAGLVLDVKGMREQNGVLPEVLTNFLALLGWSNPGRNDVLEMHELIRDFDLKFTKGNTIVRMEKLWFLQKQHVARKIERARVSNTSAPIDGIIDAAAKDAPKSAFLKTHIGDGPSSVYPNLRTYIRDILLIDSKSYQTLSQFLTRTKYLFDYDSALEPASPETYNAEYNITSDKLRNIAEYILTHSATSEAPSSPPENNNNDVHLDAHISRTSALLHNRIHAALLNHLGNVSDAGTADKAQQKEAYKAWNRALMRYLRDKLSYGLPGPGIGQIMAVLGYKECCTRLGVSPNDEGSWSPAKVRSEAD